MNVFYKTHRVLFALLFSLFPVVAAAVPLNYIFLVQGAYSDGKVFSGQFSFYHDIDGSIQGNILTWNFTGESGDGAFAALGGDWISPVPIQNHGSLTISDQEGTFGNQLLTISFGFDLEDVVNNNLHSVAFTGSESNGFVARSLNGSATMIPNAVPLPASMALMGTALIGLGWVRRRKHG